MFIKCVRSKPAQHSQTSDTPLEHLEQTLRQLQAWEKSRALFRGAFHFPRERRRCPGFAKSHFYFSGISRFPDRFVRGLGFPRDFQSFKGRLKCISSSPMFKKISCYQLPYVQVPHEMHYLIIKHDAA